ncbi:DUF411 domain-containing protein [Rubrimonas cliftonensis]|nr:DUF411 domain-containing protein [Rubrimonas cliftonensis]
MNRRQTLAAILAGGAVLSGLVSRRAAAEIAERRLTVAKSPTCGCCSAWVDHMRAAGFEVETLDMTSGALAARKARLGLRPELASCHTGEIAGYFVEGHVPAADVARLLETRPEALGLTVPGMPFGSPGMEYGDRRDAFDTLLVMRDGSTAVFASH